MGWSDCGKDSKGRPVGYTHSAKCDHPGCDEQIDRGLSYACGGMHGENEIGCDEYFCEDHLSNVIHQNGSYDRVCDKCIKELRSSGEWAYDEDEDHFSRVKV